MAQTDERVEFERLLEFVRVERNFDFTGYKRSSVTRRTDKRMRELDLKRRIFRADGVAGRYHGLRRMAMRPPGSDAPADSTQSLEDRAFETGELPQVLLDSQGTVTYVNERARALFGLSDDEIGKPIQDLEISYRPIELRSLIDKATQEGRPAAVQRVEWMRGQEISFIDVHVVPLTSEAGALLGTGITFLNVTGFHDLEEQLRRSQREVESAYEELQSTVEELETTNEELQSTNEELETMNEELQSTNEELETMNEELRRRSLELNDVNVFFESVLLSVRVAVIVTDEQLRVVVWNREAEDLWGLRSDEVVGQHLLNLDIGFPVDRLRDPIRVCLSGESRRETFVTAAMNRRGRSIAAQVICTPLARDEGILGIVVLVEQIEERAEPSASG